MGTQSKLRGLSFRSRLACSAFIAIGVLLVWQPWAGAQTPVCGPWAEVRKLFKEKHGEAPVAAGVAGTAMIVVMATEDGKTFTVLMIGKNGMACGVAAGTDWQTKIERGF